MKLRATPENIATAEILLATTARVDWWRNPSGLGTTEAGTTMRFGLGGVLGSPDHIGIVKATGRAFFLEIKALGKLPDLAGLDAAIRSKSFCPTHCKHEKCHLVHQELCLRRARASGAIAMFADRAGLVVAALDKEERQ